MFPITLTPEAVKMLLANLKEDGSENKYVRFACKGGGCSGLLFTMDIDDTIDPEEDIVSEQDGIKMVVDAYSAPYLASTTVDYVNGLMNSGFKFINETKKSCGCGSSFSV